MRIACLVALLLSACSRGADPGSAVVGVYRDPDRDGLCIAREGQGFKAGLITYGDGDTNCSLNGSAEFRGDTLIVTPRGDFACFVEIRITNGVARIAEQTKACAYYCGPEADYAGRELRKTPDAAIKVTDFTGDPLC
jgi:hypothetical protein